MRQRSRHSLPVRIACLVLAAPSVMAATSAATTSAATTSAATTSAATTSAATTAAPTRSETLAAAAVPDGSSSSLTLARAVTLGATRNLELFSERFALRREESRRRATWEFYSPSILFRSGLVRERPLGPLPAQSLFTHSAGVRWRAPIGTEVGVEALMSRGLGSGPAGVDGSQGTLAIGVSQPLLKNAWLTGAALPLRETELQARLQRELFRQAFNSLLVDVETAYWDLAVAEADVEIKTRSRDRAQAQFEDTAENIRRGILAEVEIYVVQENVGFFEQELVQARQNQLFAQRRLAELLRLSPDAPLTAADPLAAPALAVPVREVVLEVGFGTSPRLAAQQLRRAQSELRERFARNQALPSLDLTAALSFVGADPSYSGALKETFSGGSPQASVGVLLGLPLDRGAVGAGVDVASAETSRQASLLESEEQRLRTELLNGVAQLETSLELLAGSENLLKLAELKLNAELEKYRNGISTLADVVRFQRDLDNASIRLRQTIRLVHVVRARLLASQGTLHDAHGIEVQ